MASGVSIGTRVKLVWNCELHRTTSPHWGSQPTVATEERKPGTTQRAHLNPFKKSVTKTSECLRTDV